MIVIFVVDTSPSMGQPLLKSHGMSRLDLAKMAVEDLVRGLSKRSVDKSRTGMGYTQDQFLLLSTGLQHKQAATAACGAGGRLLVGYGDSMDIEPNPDSPSQPHANMASFQQHLKLLQATKWDSTKPFPEDGGGAVGLNAALSAGLKLLLRYRLSNRSTENFGMGRYPSPALITPNGTLATHALQPACLFLITDGACLRKLPKEGGGSLQLQYGSTPLREFYQEPFRWDQRIFCLGVGSRVGISSTQFLHPHLKALCEVSGGGHTMLQSAAFLTQYTDRLLKWIAPPLPRELPLPDPLRIHNSPSIPSHPSHTNGSFVNGGPVCCFQSLEVEGNQPIKYRALLLLVSAQQPEGTQIDQPLWCIPEAFFPSKKLDALPPRPAQPVLFFAKYPANLGFKSFEPNNIIKALSRLDQLVLANRKAQGSSQIKLLHRDVYISEWVAVDDKIKYPKSPYGAEYFPILIPGAGRSSHVEGEENYLNIGILHVPLGNSTLATSSNPRLSTITFLPPEPQILLPLLIRCAEAEHRVVKKAEKTGNQKNVSRNIILDEHWRSEFRAYLLRLPPYYQHAMKRCLRPMIPSSVHSLLNTESMDSLPLQCFSKVCFQKIRSGEQMAQNANERLERQEADLRGVQSLKMRSVSKEDHKIGYGQYDPRSSTESFLAALRDMPAPWLVGVSSSPKKQEKNLHGSFDSGTNSNGERKSPTVMDALGDLPTNCLMAYYESRRKWIFGGSGLTTRGLHVEGVNNDGNNSQRCGARYNFLDESLLSLSGVGASSLNQTTTAKMGDYRERLLWSRAPVIGYGSNDSGVAATTAIDGSPKWSADDDAMPATFFDLRTGEFADSVQARVRSRLMVNFGNPYKEKRANSLVPERFLSQCPSSQQGGIGGTNDPRTPPGSPPHDSLSAVEEGEAIFVGKPMTRKSPTRNSYSSESDSDATIPSPPSKRMKTDGNLVEEKMSEHSLDGKTSSKKSGGNGTIRPPPPRPPKVISKKPPPPPSSKRPPPPSVSKRPSVNQIVPKQQKAPDTKHVPPPSKPQDLKQMPQPPKKQKAPDSNFMHLPSKPQDLNQSPQPPKLQKAPDSNYMPPPSKPQDLKQSPQPPKQQKAPDSKYVPPPSKPQDLKQLPQPPKQQKAPDSKYVLPPSKSQDLKQSPQPPKQQKAPDSKYVPPPSKPQDLKQLPQPPKHLDTKNATPVSKPPPRPPKPQNSKHAPRPPKVQDAKHAAAPPPKSQNTKHAPPPPKPQDSKSIPPQSNDLKHAVSMKHAPPPLPQTSKQAPSLELKGLPVRRKSIPAPAPVPLDMESPEKKPNVDLPSGWMCVWSKSQRRWYFFDSRTNRSVWQWPPPS